MYHQMAEADVTGFRENRRFTGSINPYMPETVR